MGVLAAVVAAMMSLVVMMAVLPQDEEEQAPIGTSIYAAADGMVYAPPATPQASSSGTCSITSSTAKPSPPSRATSTLSPSPPANSCAPGSSSPLGSRGESTGPRLHFEIWDGGYAGGQAIDPLAQYEAAPAPGQAPAAPSPAPAAPAAPVDQLAGATAAGGGDPSTPTPASMGSEANLQVGTKRPMRARALEFGDRLDSLGGWRARSSGLPSLRV